MNSKTPDAAPSRPLTPRELGYRMPAEWEPHAATWFTWPRPDGISFPDKYDSVPPVYAALIRHLVEVEEVHINVWDEAMEDWVRGLLLQHGTPLERVFFHFFPAYEPWCRDHGPIFLVRQQHGRSARAVAPILLRSGIMPAAGRFTRLFRDLSRLTPLLHRCSRQRR